MITETRCSFDTCECKLIYELDLSLPDNQKISTFKTAEVICSFHQGMINDQAANNAAIGQNRRKTAVEVWLLQNLASQLADVAPDGTINWKDGIKFNWSFSGIGNDRVLTISVTGFTLTINQKNQIKTFCDSTFGSGKVIVQ